MGAAGAASKPADLLLTPTARVQLSWVPVCSGILSLPADDKGALLCYEGLAELLAFLGKVGAGAAASVQPTPRQCSHLHGCPAVAACHVF